MIAYIKGILAEKLENGIIVETGGIGYEISVPLNSPVYLTGEGEEVVCHTYMAVKEDDVSLYGFADRQSLRMFRLLLGVNGVGAKAAMSILSVLDAVKLSQAIAFEDVNEISKAQGIGKKTAQRIVLELKDKVGTIDTAKVEVSDEDGFADARSEALSALMALGYARSEAAAALTGLKAEKSEEYIRKALKNLI